jgi:DNA helicase-2/ATP-dependent DNA helicase PcrA
VNWDDLTEPQRQAVAATERRVVVFGGAGSGKTTVALWCARHFLLSATASRWHRALFLTFSRTAVREIARRSGRTFADVRDRVEIHTFHGFANRILTAFARYAGLGKNLPTFRSDAEAKLLGRSSQYLGYDDLLPLALKVARTPRVKRLISNRWPLIVCDEFQDTDDMQWDLLSELSGCGRLVMLADPNQMIYAGFLGSRGVGPGRVNRALELADLVVDLGIPSHRDPTNVIPAMAEAVRKRDFGDAAVLAAIRQGRLKIHNAIPDDGLLEILRAEIHTALADGNRSIGIFGHGNRPIAELSAALFAARVDHVLIGLPEAHGEALAAMEVACRYGTDRSSAEELRLRLAVFLTASVRGNTVPDLAIALNAGAPLPAHLRGRLDAAMRRLREAAEDRLELLISAAAELWPTLNITSGNRPWNQAARTFGAIAHLLVGRSRNLDDFFAELARRITEQRVESIFDLDAGVGQSIQLMNFHQTKGREADVVILVYRDEDWFGHEQEPFSTNSRLMYVSLTRARRKNVVILPASPHPLVAPFVGLRDVRATESVEGNPVADR